MLERNEKNHKISKWTVFPPVVSASALGCRTSRISPMNINLGGSCYGCFSFF